MVDRFYEHVPLHKVEHRQLRPGEEEKDTILEFCPQPAAPMLVSCLWNRSIGWGDEIDFYSCAAITDEPPEEVAAAGHDRCIVPIQREHLQAWLTPDPKKLNRLQEILEDRDRPYYEHRLAA